MMKARAIWAAAGLAGGILLTTLVFLAWRGITGGYSVRVQTLDAPMVVHEIQALNELVSVKYTVQKVVGLEEKKTPVGSEKLLLIVQAEVLGGVDLSKIRDRDVKILPDTVKLALPPATIVHIVIDDTQTKVWDRQITWWTPWVPYNKDLERQARVVARDAIEHGAVEMGILDQARRNAEVAIRGLLQTLGIKLVIVEQPSGV